VVYRTDKEVTTEHQRHRTRRIFSTKYQFWYKNNLLL